MRPVSTLFVISGEERFIMSMIVCVNVGHGGEISVDMSVVYRAVDVEGQLNLFYRHEIINSHLGR